MNDSYVYPAVILPLFLSILIITRLLTTLFHELGHAIPAMIFTREKVTAFLGSYGDIGKSKSIKLNNRFRIFFVLNPLKWRGGMVKHSPNNLTTFKTLIILLLGPLFSLILGSAALWIVYSFDLNGFLKLFTLLFFLSAIFDLRNIYPNEKPILLYDGTFSYNDGQQIKRLLKFKNDKENLIIAYRFYENKNYNKAIELFEGLNPDYINNAILNVIINSYLSVKRYVDVKEFYTKLMDLPMWQTINSNCFSDIGVVEANLNENELALGYFNKSLDLDNNNVYSLSNRGYTYNLFENYTNALTDFNKAIEINPEFAYAYSNRAFSKIKLGLYNDAITDIDKAISIDAKDAYAYRNLGIYYLETKDYSKAIEQLQKAFELDPDTHKITHYMKIAREKLNDVSLL
jgi:tetratricopeptide (TPR) repeat protein